MIYKLFIIIVMLLYAMLESYNNFKSFNQNKTFLENLRIKIQKIFEIIVYQN